MAKNFIEEYFIGLKLDTKDAEKGLGILEKYEKQLKKIMDMQGRSPKQKGNPFKPVVEAGKEFEKVESARKKRMQQQEEANYKRSVDLAKVAYSKKANASKEYFNKDIARTKEAVKRLVKEEDVKIAKMRQFYKEEEALAKRNAKLKERLQEKANAVLRTQFARDMEKHAPKRFAQYQGDLKRQVNLGSVEGIKDVAAQMRTSTREMKRSIRSLAVVQGGLNDSTRNMIRSYVSLFALFEGTTAIKRVGMDFQSMRASMLAASSSQENAAEKLKFVEENAYRLGVNLREATRAYMQLSIAGKDVLSENQIKDLFVSTLEVSTALGMSIDDTKGTFRSFVQMLSKGNVQAEELRGQLG